MGWLVLSSVFMAICTIVLSFIVFSLARQIGVLHERTQPMASDLRTVASREGEILSGLDIPTDTLDTDTVVLLFAATTCVMCRMLHGTFLASLKQHAAYSAYWVFPMDTPAAVSAYAAMHELPVANILVETDLAAHCAVTNTPTLVRLQRDKQGWRLQLRRSIVSTQQLHSLLADDLQANEDVGIDDRLGAGA